MSVASTKPVGPTRAAASSDWSPSRPLHSQRVRFARPDILFYDAHRIDLYQLICALYLTREDKEAKEIAHILGG